MKRDFFTGVFAAVFFLALPAASFAALAPMGDAQFEGRLESGYSHIRARVKSALPGSPGILSGGGNVSGFGNFFCSPMNGPSGFMSGGVFLSGSIEVNGNGGVHGDIPVSGNALLNGQCSYGSGYVSGFTTVSGSGPVYDAQGNPAGTAQLSGDVSINVFVASSEAFIDQYVDVSGTVQ
ncbi:MAG: hypothetical protein ACYCPQ_08010 [Elusimicrobiota bacterium]